jgi:hypothetical protein
VRRRALIDKKGIKMKLFFALFLCMFGFACIENTHAQTPIAWNEAEVAWNVTTVLSDGSQIPAGEVLVYRVERQAPNTTTWVVAGCTAALVLRIPNLPAGVNGFRVLAGRVTGGVATCAATNLTWSQPSNPATKNVMDNRPPNPPTGLLVASVSPGSKESPMFALTATNTRSATVVAMVPVGGKCEDPALFTYRGQSYYRIAATTPRYPWPSFSQTIGAVACVRTATP